MKYRKKSVVVEARQWSDTPSAGESLAEWCGGTYNLRIAHGSRVTRSEWIEVETPDGSERADLRDWIIKDEFGDFYVVESYRFNATFEVVKDD